MNKNEAAELLGISLRSLERYTSQGRVSASYVKGKTRAVVDYEPSELERFKAELEETSPTSPPITGEIGEATRPVNPANSDTRLARLANDTQGAGLLAAVVAQAVAETLNQLDDKRAPSSQEIAAKLVYTLAECQVLTGFSRAFLRAAIKDGGLAAKQIGKAWRVKRTDLEAWISKL